MTTDLNPHKIQTPRPLTAIGVTGRCPSCAATLDVAALPDVAPRLRRITALRDALRAECEGLSLALAGIAPCECCTVTALRSSR